MKIIHLEVNDVRGIRSFEISPKGRNFAIWGPNGSGKSAVVDAIDFLLCGQVSRLTRRGTGGITLNRHGPHVDSIPENAEVRAVLQVNGVSDPIEISRSMDNPSTLRCDEKFRSLIDPIIGLAKRGQHVLSRREILRFITSESSFRANDIQTLMDISDIENIRRNLLSIKNESDRDLRSAEGNLGAAQSRVATTIQEDTFNETATIIFINENRKILGAKPIEVLDSSKIQEGIVLPKSVSGEHAINITLIRIDFENTFNFLSPEVTAQLLQYEDKLRSTLEEIRADPDRLRELYRISLLTTGKKLIDDSGDCPLCETEWPSGALMKLLNKRLQKAEDAKLLENEIHDLSTSIKATIDNATQSIGKIKAVIKASKLPDTTPSIEDWLSKLSDLSMRLNEPLEKYPDPELPEELIYSLVSPENMISQLEDVLEKVENLYPESSPEQTAWDSLTRLVENIMAFEDCQRHCDNAAIYQGLSHAVHNQFIDARDEVLCNLYSQIKDRFVEFYRDMHGPDEEDFKARIEPDRAGLAFEVDFYGRAFYPPHALHSEGHQDSMGICLYLALSERLTTGVMDFTILDDVVMSVDSSHRRKFCELIRKHFPDRQFLITTHDRTWAKELCAEGVIQSDCLIEFYKWTIETGPHVNLENDLWDRIENFLDSNDVENAAFLLRKGSEEFFAYICDSLEAEIPFRIDGRYDLGQYMPSAIHRYKELITKSKQAAQTWNKDEDFEVLTELDSAATQIFQRTNIERWVINPNAHFSNWSNFEKEDFTTVRDAFQELHAIFICQDCGTILRLVKEGYEPVGVKCKCSKMNWNLNNNK